MKIIKLTAVGRLTKKQEVYINENHIIFFHESPYAETRIYLTSTDASYIDVMESVDKVMKLLTQE